MMLYLMTLATFVGTIIGVGLFGLPFVAAKVGILPMFFYFILLGSVSVISHLMFGQVCLSTKSEHRLPGYVEIYLGKKIKLIPIITNLVGLYLSNLAYIIIGGSFLAGLLMPIVGGNYFIYILIYFAAGAFIIHLGAKTVANSELISMVIFFSMFLILLIISLPRVAVTNFTWYMPTNISNLFLPYGVILYAISGMVVIPEIKEFLGTKKRLLKPIIIVGLVIAVLTYLAFTLVILGVTGQSTTEDALTGLGGRLGSNIIVAGYLFGILTTFTSYITIGLALKKIYIYDLKFKPFEAWVFACFIPLILYFAGLQDFIAIIGFSGAVTLGIDSFLVFLLYIAVKKKPQRKPEYNLPIPGYLAYILAIFFLAGAVLEIVNILA